MEARPPVTTNAVTGLTGRERIRAFDLALGLAVFFMILVHVLWHWGAPWTWATPMGFAISFAAGPTAAPVFVFLMGASLGAAPPSRFAALAARGLWLVFLGYVLNVFRGYIPATVGLTTGVITLEKIAPFTPWWLLTTVDLHAMIGFSLVIIAALHSRLRPGWGWLAIAAGVAVAAGSLRGLSFGTPLLDAPLTPFLGSAPNVYYAVIPWVVYPLVGTVFGGMIVRAADRTRLFRRAAMVGIGLGLVGLTMIAVERPGFDVYTYWRQPISFVVAILGIILMWLALCDLVTRRLWIDRRLGVVYGWSNRVVAMYFTHWVIVGWGVGLVGFRDLGLGPVLVAMASVVVATTYLSHFAVRLEEWPWQRLSILAAPSQRLRSSRAPWSWARRDPTEPRRSLAPDGPTPEIRVAEGP
jgi:uncharacterized membrane protein